MGFKEWFFEPLVEMMLGDKGVEIASFTKEELEEACYKVEFKEGKPSYIFKPSTLDEFIGQERAKSILRETIAGTKRKGEIFPHTLIYGPAGYGKTTLAEILAKELQVKFIELITSQLTYAWDLMDKINQAEGGIVFLDEIHSLPRDIAESIYTIMTHFTFQGKHIKEFTLVGATTELGELLKDRKPFKERFIIPLGLQLYTIEDMITITKQFKEKTYPQDVLEEEIYTIIAKNSRGTPRTAERLMKLTSYYNGNIQKVLQDFDILKDGFTGEDLNVLKYIARNEKGVGLQGLASYLGTSADNYVYDIEPYLLQNNLIIRTSRGRKITEEGKMKIQELEKEQINNSN